MSLSAAIIDALVQSGATVEQLAAAVKADMAEREAAMNNKRAKDAERQRRHRLSRDVTVTNGDGCDVTPPGFLDKEKSPRPPKEINPSRECETRARGWHRLPGDWAARPLPAPVQAKVDQWPPGEVGDVLSDFRRWAANAEDKNGKGRKLDWDQAWRNWIGRHHNERHSRKPANSNNGLGRTGAAAIAAFGDPNTW